MEQNTNEWFVVVTITATKYVVCINASEEEHKKIVEEMKSGEVKNLSCVQAYIMSPYVDEETGEAKTDILDAKSVLFGEPNSEVNINFLGDPIKIWSKIDVQSQGFQAFWNGLQATHMAREQGVQL